MTWDELDWRALDRLRDRFVRGPEKGAAYWESSDDLAAYDLTYGERIGWKWDQVLRELRLRGWQPRSRTILDWGCGSGVAARRVISFFGVGRFDSLSVWDHSALAADFAEGAADALALSGPKSLEEEIAELRAADAVDAELEAMKAALAAKN